MQASSASGSLPETVDGLPVHRSASSQGLRARDQICLGVLDDLLHLSSISEVRGVVIGAEIIEGCPILPPFVF